MQIEILKRDKLDYVFQSLSIIAVLPILFINVIKNWAIGQFSFTSQFYNGTLGFYMQIGLIIITFVCYLLVRKLKDNGSVNVAANTENPWQSKVYNNKLGKKITDYFIPKTGTKGYRKVTQLLKESASPLKLEWFYVNRIVVAVIAFCVSLFIFLEGHQMAINYTYTEPTSDYNLLRKNVRFSRKKSKRTYRI